MDLGLKDKLALVSAAARPASATPSPQRSAAEGARVIVNGRTQASVDAAVARIAPRTAARSRASPAT